MQGWFHRPTRRRIHFLHIGKTGGTALKLVLGDFLRTPRHTLTLHGHGVSITDVPKGESVIFFLRDPISRFISGFYSRQRKGAPRYCNEWSPREEEVFECFATPNDIAVALADAHSPDHDRALEAMHVIQHFAPYRKWYVDLDYFRARLPDILFIGFQESLDSDFEELKILLDLPRHLRLPTDAVAAHRSPPGLDTSIDDEGLATLRDWYAEDFHFIDLCRELMSSRDHPS